MTGIKRDFCTFCYRFGTYTCNSVFGVKETGIILNKMLSLQNKSNAISEQVVPILGNQIISQVEDSRDEISEQVVRENEFMTQVVSKLASIPWGHHIKTWKKNVANPPQKMLQMLKPLYLC